MNRQYKETKSNIKCLFTGLFVQACTRFSFMIIILTGVHYTTHKLVINHLTRIITISKLAINYCLDGILQHN